MAIRKLESTDGFVVIDFADAPAAGVVRRARKILESSATDLTRSATYTFASFEMERSGASAGVNAEGDAIGGAIQALCAELSPEAEAGRLHLQPGKGVTADQLAPLAEVSGLNPAVDADRATVAGVIAAASWAVGGSLEGQRVAVEQTTTGPAPALLVSSVEALGGTLVDVSGADEKPWLIWGAEADVIMTGSRPGVLTHEGAELVTARAVVPWGQIPVTTKALAVLLRKGETTVVPDFVSIAGGLVAGYLEGEADDVIRQIVSTVTTVLIESDHDDEGVLLGACRRAEAFISRWQPALPFGRPLAA